MYLLKDFIGCDKIHMEVVSMSPYRGFTPAQAKAHKKYMESVATIQIRVTPERRDAIKAHAAARGESVNGFIGRAITETMNRDNGGTSTEAAQKPTDAFSGGGATPILSGVENAVQGE